MLTWWALRWSPEAVRPRYRYPATEWQLLHALCDHVHRALLALDVAVDDERAHLGYERLVLSDQRGRG